MQAFTTHSVSLESVQYTQKAQMALQTNFSHLKGRERQFLLLLMREDNISRQACARLITKVDLLSLANQGYIQVQGLSIANASNDDKVSAETQVSFSSLSKQLANSQRDKKIQAIEPHQFYELPDPILQLAAGKF